MKKGFLVPAILCIPFNCQANDYFFKPIFSTSERYASNLLLRPNPQQGNWISKLSPGINVGINRENDALKSNFTWNQIFYTNQSALNISEQLFSADYQHTGERLQWGLNGHYNNQSSLNSETTVQGFSPTQVMVKNLSIAPTASYSLTELSSVDLDYSYSKSTYEQTRNIFLNSYDYQQASGTFNHNYTENDKLNATVSSSRYKISTGAITTFNNIAQTGWQHSFSETLSTYISVGINYSLSESEFPVAQLIPINMFGFSVYQDPLTGQFFDNQRYGTANTSTTGFGGVYRASIQKAFERGSISLVGSQNQTPTSQGMQTQSQLSANTSYNIYERWSSGLSASYSIYKPPAQLNSQLNNERIFATISPTINWKWTPEVNVGLSYTYRQQELKTNSQISQDNSVQLQLNYQPQTNNQVK
ncbi:porin family protein [Methylobacter psychrophilus]|uniref:hypothetical protein n=1 Tax=Methylobacter psychrophilus TaxID=96941 RepID=UPI0021D51B54|nr:hypothetical protein [Methylobacter psychrophilus]